MQSKTGDKVKFKAGTNGHSGSRGVISKVQASSVLVKIDDSDDSIWVKPDEITNFSLAARKAWVSMPKRNVGRKKGTRFADRVSVTLRIDRETWEKFKQLENRGIIDDRTGTINQWLEKQLSALEHRSAERDAEETD